jgi:hypothetical protein
MINCWQTKNYAHEYIFMIILEIPATPKERESYQRELFEILKVGQCASGLLHLIYTCCMIIETSS